MHSAISQAIRSAIRQSIEEKKMQAVLWTPATLFAASEPGVWYDPSDFSTMFQDSSGTTPVTAVEQPVGLILDKSKGLVLGQEYVTNAADREFTSDTGFWAKEGNSSISGGVVNINNAPGTYAIYKFNFPNTPGGYVEISFDLVITAGAVSVRYGGAYSQIFTTSGKKTVRMYRPAVGTFGIVSAGAVTALGTIDNISVRELPGNHAYQSTSTSRPTLSARYNLLTKTEDFSDSAWGKYDTSITPNAVAAPDGTTTADYLIGNGGGGQQFISQLYNMAAGVSHKFSVYAKANTCNYVMLSRYDGVSYYLFATFDLVNGTVNNGGSGSASIISVGNGWYLCSVTASAAAASATNFQIRPSTSSTPTLTGPSSSSGIYIWGADLRVANTGVDLPAYQRVNTATDYDTTGFPHYLRFDGVDDWLVTPTITPGTDKVQVFAGVRKLSDAAAGVVAELSASITANNGSFLIDAPDVPAQQDYGFYIKGTALTDAPANGFPAPDTAVLSLIGDISSASNKVIARRNSVQVGSTSGTAGTGNYLAYPLYIGRRGGTTLPFNGHLYGLIVRFGANLPAGTIASTETWLNQRTGAY